MLAFLSSVTLLSLLVNAAVTPTSPESATTVRIGQPLTAQWAADTTGMWTDMTVQLMTGDNLQVSLDPQYQGGPAAALPLK
jgi:hypothetical protein